MTSRSRPDATEYASFYAPYVAIVPEGDIVALLARHGEALHDVLSSVSEERAGYRYAEGKWSIREVAGHLVDAERIFTYRALRIGRGDTTPLPGFEENSYVAASDADARTLASLLAELQLVRGATVALFASLPEAAWLRRGTASDREITVRALAYIALGHTLHHLRVLRERYAVIEAVG